ncbi:tetratricopeptide repeat protein [Chitinasiproducens palmae]|uniref:Tetratricopeptide repeat-containing protein n=1 Tax=Chitinasiproducens palmae TaxID=1770053 RepID=A0A1H2PSF5_9BURK|nr:tetratricopeptide repeat protein [Chitinasiproducens palmae]SDV49924.1 Tetratricopeptide repeat-containing protein [Chitinasiproducens palmae]
MQTLKQRARALCLATVVGVLCAGPAVSWSAPTVNDVERAVQRGDYPGAEQMLSEVIAAHPSSARAHYLYAQVLDRDGKATQARDEIARARTLDPALGFTDPNRFRQMEARINADAARASRGQQDVRNPTESPRRTDAPPAYRSTPAATNSGLGAGGILGVIAVLALIAGVLIWSVRRSRGRQARDVEATRLAELKRATALLDQVRAIKLDLKLSTAAQRDGWLAEAQQVEQDLSEIIEQLSQGPDSATAPTQSPAFRLEDLGRQVERLEALAAGRPDPGLGREAPAGSAYADEANRFGRAGQQSGPGPYYPQQQQQAGPVIVQQPGSGMGGGLMAGVLIGEMMSQLGHHRDGGRADSNSGNSGHFGSGNDLGPGMGPFEPGNGWHDGDSAPSDSGFDFGSGGSGGSDWGGGNDSFDTGSSGGNDDWNS